MILYVKLLHYTYKYTIHQTPAAAVCQKEKINLIPVVFNDTLIKPYAYYRIDTAPKKLREHSNQTSVLNWCILYNLLRTKWYNNWQRKLKSSTHWGLDSKPRWKSKSKIEIRGWSNFIWANHNSVMCLALLCLYALPTTSGYAPDESAIVSWTSVSSWTVCGDTWRHQIHRYKTSRRCSIGFRVRGTRTPVNGFNVFVIEELPNLSGTEPVACWMSFSRSLEVLLLFLLAQRSRYRSCCWVDALPQPCPALLVSWYLLYALETVLGSHSKPSLCGTYECAILEELDYMCNLIELQVPPHATSSDKDTSRTQN